MRNNQVDHIKEEELLTQGQIPSNHCHIEEGTLKYIPVKFRVSISLAAICFFFNFSRREGALVVLVIEKNRYLLLCPFSHDGGRRKRT